jgi:acyl-CoA synthetase (AMP-forming)/AMP-acid ligase II
LRREKSVFLIYIGAALLFPSESFNAEATLKAIVQHGATALYGVPTMFLAELELVSGG